MTGKTSTITIHHDRCDVSKWTIAEWQTLATFVKGASLVSAAALSNLGMQLVVSEHYEPVGGTLEDAGWTAKGADDFTDDLSEFCTGGEVLEVRRVYRGPVQYAVPIPMGDGEGNFEGYEFAIKDTESEATAYLASIFEPEPA